MIRNVSKPYALISGRNKFELRIDLGRVNGRENPWSFRRSSALGKEGAVFSVSLHAGKSSPPRKIEKGDAIVARVQSVHELFVPLFYVSSVKWMRATPTRGMSLLPHPLNAFFLFSFSLLQSRKPRPPPSFRSPAALDEICCFVDDASTNNRSRKNLSGITLIPVD